MPNFHLLFDDSKLRDAVKIAATIDGVHMGEWIIDAVEKKMVRYLDKDKRIAEFWRPQDEKKVASA